MKENLTKPPATKYLDMPTEITNMVLRAQLRSAKESPETRAGADSVAAQAVGALAGRKVALNFITTGHTSHRFAFKFTHLYSLGIPNQLNNVRRVPISFYHRGIC